MQLSFISFIRLAVNMDRNIKDLRLFNDISRPDYCRLLHLATAKETMQRKETVEAFVDVHKCSKKQPSEV